MNAYIESIIYICVSEKLIVFYFDENLIEFCVVNTSASNLTNKTSLFIGIKDKTLIPKYEEKVKQLFTSEHYRQIYMDKHQNIAINL